VRKRRQPEQDIQRAVVEHLQARAVRGLFFFHVPNGGVRSKAEAAIFAGLGVVPGVPDLAIIHNGRCFGLELKTEERGPHLSPTQIETQRLMREAGVTIATAHGLDAAVRQLESWGVLRGQMIAA
jgi:hypothetical protein